MPTQMFEDAARECACDPEIAHMLLIDISSISDCHIDWCFSHTPQTCRLPHSQQPTNDSLTTRSIERCKKLVGTSYNKGEDDHDHYSSHKGV
jgi:hypothetical protein